MNGGKRQDGRVPYQHCFFPLQALLTENTGFLDASVDGTFCRLRTTLVIPVNYDGNWHWHCSLRGSSATSASGKVSGGLERSAAVWLL